VRLHSFNRTSDGVHELRPYGAIPQRLGGGPCVDCAPIRITSGAVSPRAV
jgi:hypothetical protein